MRPRLLDLFCGAGGAVGLFGGLGGLLTWILSKGIDGLVTPTASKRDRTWGLVLLGIALIGGVLTLVLAGVLSGVIRY